MRLTQSTLAVGDLNSAQTIMGQFLNPKPNAEVRGFEWFTLVEQTQRGTIRLGAAGTQGSAWSFVAISPTGRRCLAMDLQRCVVFDVRSEAVVEVLGPPEFQSRHVIFGSDDNTLI